MRQNNNKEKIYHIRALKANYQQWKDEREKYFEITAYLKREGKAAGNTREKIYVTKETLSQEMDQDDNNTTVFVRKV